MSGVVKGLNLLSGFDNPIGIEAMALVRMRLINSTIITSDKKSWSIGNYRHAIDHELSLMEKEHLSN